MSQAIHLAGAVYTDRISGGDIFESLQEMHRFESIRLIDAALVIKEDDGKLHVVEVADHSIARGHGRAIKALIQKVFPRHLATSTKDDLSVEQATAMLHDLGVEEQSLQKIVDDMPVHGALVLALADTQWQTPISNALHGADGRLIQMAVGPASSAAIVAMTDEESAD